jgi:Fic family protein
MIFYNDIELGTDICESLKQLDLQILTFRDEGPLDKIAVKKLEEHFKASHIYHSAGIEGNRLTLQETAVVLSDGIDISDKPIKDSVEVKNLGKAFDFLRELSKKNQTLRESDIRDLHKLIVGNFPETNPGAYRNIGVIISGADHRPPEPLAIPGMMTDLVQWVNLNVDKNPIQVSALAHHQLVYIHPFMDGNGRVARLLMNLILLQKGYPICNISREMRPKYYESLSFADVGLYEPMVQIVYEGCYDLFSEYRRIRNEGQRAQEYAKKWGQTSAAAMQRRESRELELWQNRMQQIYLEFENTTDLLDEEIKGIEITIHPFKESVDLEKYLILKNKGSTEHTHFFAINLKNIASGINHKFMFRFFRNFEKFPRDSQVVPLELNYFREEDARYTKICALEWHDKIRIRELYYSEKSAKDSSSEKFMVRYYDAGSNKEVETDKIGISDAVKMFFDDILKNVLGLS